MKFKHGDVLRYTGDPSLMSPEMRVMYVTNGIKFPYGEPNKYALVTVLAPWPDATAWAIRPKGYDESWGVTGYTGHLFVGNNMEVCE